MRLIFITLVIANLALLAWGFLMPPGPEAEAPPDLTPNPYSDYATIYLLSELDSAKAILERSQARSSSSEQAKEETGDISQFPSATPTSQDGRSSQEQQPEHEGKLLCELVGPFEDGEQAADFVERLDAIEVAAEIKELELPAGPGYWVYLLPEPSRKEALRRLAELQAKRVDSYVIPKGDLENGISLGMFSKKLLADARVQSMRAIGLDPKVEEIERTYREIWAMLQPQEAGKMSELTWQRVTEGMNSLERRQNYCLDVASQ